MPVLFYSALDPAGVNAARTLREKFGFAKKTAFGDVAFTVWKKNDLMLAELQTPLLTSDFLDDYFQSDLFVFLSKHKSESAKPCFTTHAPGNFGSAEMGGKKGELCLTSASALKTAFDFLQGKDLPAFREATHHGPTSLKTPAIFIEVGSSEKEWKNEDFGGVIAECALHVCSKYASCEAEAAIGFGGNHYCSAFSKIDLALSHVAPKYALGFVNEKMVAQMVAKTSEKVTTAVIDWEGCSSEDRENAIECCKANNLVVERA